MTTGYSDEDTEGSIGAISSIRSAMAGNKMFLNSNVKNLNRKVKETYIDTVSDIHEMPKLGGFAFESLAEFFKDFSKKIEGFVDFKLNRFYVTRKEHNIMKKIYVHEIDKIKNQLNQHESEKENLLVSIADNRRIIDELSENAKRLLELNNQLKELIKNNTYHYEANLAEKNAMIMNSVKEIKQLKRTTRR
ncbi:MAG: hypothetical protein Q8O89_00520 [Nanoarchaeota archaeon]|nr:hypothetical protein [Nanoarchaeota archaeon]